MRKVYVLAGHFSRNATFTSLSRKRLGFSLYVRQEKEEGWWGKYLSFGELKNLQKRLFQGNPPVTSHRSLPSARNVWLPMGDLGRFIKSYSPLRL